MHTEEITYQHETCIMKAYLAYDEKITSQRPAILITHDWSGRNEFACQKAEKMATLGYIGFAVDMYGEAQVGTNNEEKMALIAPLKENRALVQARMLAALKTLKTQPHVDTNKIAAIGFCFGGMCVLDLARTGTDMSGVVSLHGLLDKAQNIETQTIKTKVLVLHGYDDPMVPPEQVNYFASEMTKAKADWQVHIYGNTQHAFTNPIANDPKLGTVYNAVADKRSWRTMKNFFDEVFA